MNLLIREVIPRPLFFLLISEFYYGGKTLNSNFKDITGQKFGELTAMRPDLEKTRNSKNNSVYWVCLCSCGAEKSILGSHLRNGYIVTCGNRKIHWAGENSTNWRGGICTELQCARTTKEYKEWRSKVYALDRYTCQCCLKNKKIKKEAHHMYNFSEYKELRYNVNFGVTLCYDCHSMYQPGSFHHTYGTRNNTPQQLEEYINNKRKQLGILIPFNIDEYIKNKNVSKLDQWIEFINTDPEDLDFEELLDKEE